MSSAAESVKIQNSPVKETKPKAPRKPTLAAKYNKMLVFGYSLTESLRAKGVFSDELVEQVFAELHLMSPVDEQVTYYENILSQAGANAKVMKKFIAAKNKPVKEPKVRKPRAKKSVTVQSDASDEDVIQNLVDAARDVAPKEKKPRKNAKKSESEVEAKPDSEPKEKNTKAKKAKVETPVQSPEPKDKKTKAKKAEAAPVEAPEPKEKKTKAKKTEAVPVEAPEPKVDPAPKEKKTKAKKAEAVPVEAPEPKVDPAPKEKKTKAKKEPEPQPEHEDDDDDEEILTKETSIDGVPFLIDQHNNLYDPVSHEFVRTL
jgi:hypothetical protein